MTQHTQGPWTIERNHQSACVGYRGIIDAEGFVICDPSPMGEANAQLIAAAPDLLEALETTFKALLDGTYDENNVPMILDALKKAKGEDYDPEADEYEPE